MNAMARMRESYRSMFENSPQPMYVVEPSTLRFREVNDAAVRQYGYTREEFLAMTLVDIWPSEQVEKNREIFARPLPLHAVITRHRKRDGSLCWMEIRANELSFDGRTSRLVLVDDVTERLAAGKARRAAEARFARLSDSGIIGIIVTTLDGRVIEVNDALLDLVGHSRQAILSGDVRWTDLTPREWRDLNQRARQQLGATGVAGLREKEYFRKDGARVPVLVGSAMLDEASGDCISFVLDLRENRLAAAAVEHLREARASEATFRSFVEAVPDAVIVIGRDGGIVLVNSQTERLFGYAREELVGQPAETMIPERFRDQYRIRFEGYFAEPRAAGPRRRDGHGLRKDGTEFPFESTVGLLESEGGTLLCSSVRDTTERNKAEEARRRAEVALGHAKDAAEAANRELEAFSYSVAHDLRTPLRGMNGFAQVLLDTYRDKLDADGQDWLQEIILGASKMGSLIDGLLALARLTRGELRREPVDLSSVARAAAKQLARVEPHRVVETVVQESLCAEVDPPLARALVENLLGNAWKFTGKVSAPRIEFGATEKDGERTFFVRDNGAGFDMAFASKLFSPFQRLHSVEEFPGTGIGLATVQRIVHRHGGRIWAEAAVDGGASFYFTLPERASGTTPGRPEQTPASESM
jgi:PAS domain S-box-containing protein